VHQVKPQSTASQKTSFHML